VPFRKIKNEWDKIYQASALAHEIISGSLKLVADPAEQRATAIVLFRETAETC
jgi:hypothetical protein